MCKSGGQVRFIFRNKLLYREYECKDHKKIYQLVVPDKCRVMKEAHEADKGGHIGIR